MAPYNKASEAPVESVYTPTVKSVLYTEVRRIQKIASAVYLVTDFFDTNEILKRHMRETSVELIALGHIPEGQPIKDILNALARMLSFIDALVSFTELARLTHKLSDMNASLLSRELISIHMTLSQRYHNFLDQELHMHNLKDTAQDVSIDFKNFFEDTSSSALSPQPRKVEKDPSTGSTSSLQTSSPQGKEEVLKEDRKRQILDIVKDKHEVSIKDIAPRILKCSEKTLQRDLQELIVSGELKKTGERRWSKYSLAKL